MKTISAISLLLFTTFLLLSCNQTVKETPLPQDNKTNLITSLNSIKEPSKEEESKIKLTINFDGKWRKESSGSKAMIIITGKTGKVVANNGGEIPILIKFLNENTIKIFEYEYNPKYLSNWLPEKIASQIYLNELLKKTYSVLRIIDENTLSGVSYAWQVSFSSSVVQKIEPLVTTEVWKRITEK